MNTRLSQADIQPPRSLRAHAPLVSLLIVTLMLACSNARASGHDRLVPILSLLLFANRTPAVSLSVGANQNCVTLQDGGIACWGYNLWGQLGNGSKQSTANPIDVRSIRSAIAVASGVRHSCAVLDNGHIRCWGGNTYGQLGNGSSGNSAGSTIPVGVASITSGSSIAAGDEFSCAVLSDGSVKCWGRGSNGQLGNGSSGASADHDTPVSLSLSNYTAGMVSTGANQACLVDNYVSLVNPLARCWGNNTSGQLGDGSNTLRNTPQTVRNTAGSGSLAGVTRISTSGSHSCAVISTGLVFCWGANNAGQIGKLPGAPGSANLPQQVSLFGSTLPDAISVSAGTNHSCALTNNGQVWCWGDNTYGQLGRGMSAIANYKPVRVTSINTATVIGSGEFHSCALLENRSVKCWGRNNHKQLGVDGPAASNIPLKVRGLSEISSP